MTSTSKGRTLAVVQQTECRRHGEYTTPDVYVWAQHYRSSDGVQPHLWQLHVWFQSAGWVLDQSVRGWVRADWSIPNVEQPGQASWVVAVAECDQPLREIVEALIDGEPLEMAFDRLVDLLPEDHPFCRAMAAGAWKESET